MIKLMMITNHPDIARAAVSSGVNRIFVDLEILGKIERQGHLSTVISRHTMDDVACIRQALPHAELLVRLNPYNPATQSEVNAAIDAGADLLMLPMFNSINEIASFCELVNRRVGIVPLLETPLAMETLPDWINTPGISEVYIGLNDLHLGLKMDFMFQPLANGMMDKMVHTIKQAGLPFGFGGIARVNEGLLPAEFVLAEHMRLGSSSVILSRTFHRNSNQVYKLETYLDFKIELEKLRQLEQELQLRSVEQVEFDRQAVIEKINIITESIRKKKQSKEVS